MKTLPILFKKNAAICSNCGLYPLCFNLSFKELAIVQLLLQKMEDKTIFFTLHELHHEFIRKYFYERDGYETFYNIVNGLVNTDSLLLKTDSNNLSEKSIKNEVLYSLNPAYSYDYTPISKYHMSICPIGMNCMCFRIIDLLVSREAFSSLNGLTIKQITRSLKGKKDKSKKSHPQTIRRRINEIAAINLILVKEQEDKRKPIIYYANVNHFLIKHSSLSKTFVP